MADEFSFPDHKTNAILYYLLVTYYRQNIVLTLRIMSRFDKVKFKISQAVKDKYHMISPLTGT